MSRPSQTLRKTVFGFLAMPLSMSYPLRSRQIPVPSAADSREFSCDGVRSSSWKTCNFPANPFETIPPEEESQIKELVDLTVKLLAKRYSAPNPSLRGVHPKSHGCVQATFEVNRDLIESRK